MTTKNLLDWNVVLAATYNVLLTRGGLRTPRWDNGREHKRPRAKIILEVFGFAKIFFSLRFLTRLPKKIFSSSNTSSDFFPKNSALVGDPFLGDGCKFSGN